LLKNPEMARLKVVIRPETVAMVDYAQLKQERTEYINALAVFMQSAAPLLEQDPAMMPYLMRLLQWGLSGFKGSSEIEGVIDKAIDAAERKAKEPQPEDPAAAAAAAEHQMAMQMEQLKQQGQLATIQAKATADMQLREHDMEADIATTQAEHQAKMAEITAELEAVLAETQAKMHADITVETVKYQGNMQQTAVAVAGELTRDTTNAQLDIAKEENKTNLKLAEIEASAAAKIKEGEGKKDDKK
jgi:hypothetical protein